MFKMTPPVMQSRKKPLIDHKQESEMIANRPIYDNDKGPDPGSKKSKIKNNLRFYEHSPREAEFSSNELEKSRLAQWWIRFKQLKFGQSEHAKLILDLDQHYSSLFVLFHQYEKHFFFMKCTNGMRSEAAKLKRCAEMVKSSIHRIGNRMADLGVIPTSTLKKQSQLSYIKHEPEGRPGRGRMFARDLAHENVIFKNLVKTAERSVKLNDQLTIDLTMALTEDVHRRLRVMGQVFQSSSPVGGNAYFASDDHKLVNIDDYRKADGTLLLN